VLAGRYSWLEDGIADPSGDGPMMPPLVEPAAAGDEVAASPDATAASPDATAAGQGHPEDASVAGEVQ
jgi:hypothetical protein